MKYVSVWIGNGNRITATALQAEHLSSTASDGANIPMTMRKNRHRYTIDIETETEAEIFIFHNSFLALTTLLICNH